MRKALPLVAILGMLIAAPAAGAHKVTPPGAGAPTCTTNVHAGDASNPAHEGGMVVADAYSDAITPGPCLS
jgi:hypothetical protein